MARLYPVLGVTLLVAFWAVAVAMSPSPVLPGPVAAARALVELALDGSLFRHLIASLFRVTWGFLGAALIGIPLGLTLGWCRAGQKALNPLVQLVRPISPVAWTPLAILWFGVGDLAAVFLIFIAAAVPLVMAAMNAARGVSAVHVNAGRNFGLGPTAVLTRVILPATMPSLIVGLRLALGISWVVVVAGEMLAVSSGLGFLIVDARNTGRYDFVVAGMVAIGLVGWALDAGLRALERRWVRR